MLYILIKDKEKVFEEKCVKHTQRKTPSTRLKTIERVSYRNIGAEDRILDSEHRNMTEMSKDNRLRQGDDFVVKESVQRPDLN